MAAALLWTRRHRRALALIAIAVIAGLAFTALRGLLHEVHLSQVRAALTLVPAMRLVLAVGLTALSFAALSCYDRIALGGLGRRLPVATTTGAALASYAFGQALGLSLLVGGSARYRVYRRHGLRMGEVAQVALIAAGAFWAGLLSLAGMALLQRPDLAGRVAGVGALAVAFLPAVLRATGRTMVRAGPVRLPLPSLPRQAALWAAAVIDLSAAAGALYVLVPGAGAAGLASFVLAYAAAVTVTLVSHVPGGIGVFEAVMIAAAAGDRAALFAALLLYRLIYYVLPFALAAAGLLVVEGLRLRHSVARYLTLAGRAARLLASFAVAVLMSFGGLILLVSGALPGVRGRLTDLSDVVPLPFIEGSHLAGSLVGTAMLLLVPGLRARLLSAFQAARLLLLAGAIFSLTKGFDYEEALIQLAILALLQFCRPRFDRRGGIFTDPPAWRWIAVAAIALALSIWAGLFAYQHTPYADDLWWRFALDGNAPRFLRASFAAGVLLAAAAAWQLLAGGGRSPVPTPLPPQVCAAALAASGRSDANLALTGDKNFIVSAGGDAFLMYRVQGRSWVVMGDPVGPRAAWEGLVWAIRRQAHAHRGRLCFFQASDAMLPLFVDLGLAAMKYGEEAHIDPAAFTLDGHRGKSLRHALRRCAAAGEMVELIPAADVPALAATLRGVSDAWLERHPGREKRFSLGGFDAAYLAQFDVAVVRRGAEIVAFANLWRSGDGAELSIDLMRYRPDAAHGTMEMLLVWLIEYARTQGCRRFNLGMAPLSGLPSGALAPLWARLGRLLFVNGERLYGFAGLRAFKAKFGPRWTPRFVATPPGLAAAQGLIAIAQLVNS